MLFSVENHEKFAAFTEGLPLACNTLVSRAPVTGGAKPDFGVEKSTPKRGVYLFTEKGTHMYVGRSNRLFERYKNHWGTQSSGGKAAFAFKLARQTTGFSKATYKKGPGSRQSLDIDPTFKQAFKDAKERIRAMEYRWVEATDPTFQCLLEIYVSIVLATKYNDFDTH
ncbi:MAG: hypothetical protein KGQ46_05290 [Hyphomicrobiales bacterium]|nr:hypothetical protein [Hyphomicrobiales bacterium]MDE2113500.1 hypothetical protein [Hyphomicrobiales bacterium]